MKYVIRADGTVKVFPRTSIHAYQVCGCPEEDCPRRAVSAGFYNTETGEAYGESTSIGVKSRPEDSQIIRDSKVT